jgi:hypothetical protein
MDARGIMKKDPSVLLLDLPKITHWTDSFPVLGPNSCIISNREIVVVLLSDVLSFNVLLDTPKISDLNRLLQSGDGATIDRLAGSGVTLTTAMFLGLSETVGLADPSRSAIISLLPGVGDVRACLQSATPQRTSDAFGAPLLDFYRISAAADVLSDEWPLFYDRFRRSASNGQTSHMLRAVGGVLGEMGDNVPSHAYANMSQPCRALAGFHVCGSIAAFCVADWGRGFLDSLRENPKWKELATDQEALSAVVKNHATRRTDESEGGGFKQLFKVLLDFNGLVILRSGACSMRLVNQGHVRQAQVTLGEYIPGSSITVIIALDGVPAEKPLWNKIPLALLSVQIKVMECSEFWLMNWRRRAPDW